MFRALFLCAFVEKKTFLKNFSKGALKRLQKVKKFAKITQVKVAGKTVKYNGASPSGKATDSDSVIRVFESLRPSQKMQVADLHFSINKRK